MCMKSSYLRLAARGTVAGLVIFCWLYGAPARRTAEAGEEKKNGDAKPFVFRSVLTSGKKAGDLVLGRTTYEEVLKIYPAPPFNDYDGHLRPVDETYQESYPSIKFVYNPWQTMYALFFDEDRRLVMVSELYELGALTEKELFRRYPGLTETGRSGRSIEYQAGLHECVSLVAAVEKKGRTVEQLSWVRTCE